MGQEAETHEVVIVGAGIAGLATAVAFHRVGVRSLVLERSSELRAAGTALHILPNGWRALDALGVADKLVSVYDSVLIGGRRIDVVTGATEAFIQRETARKNGIGTRLVHRKKLLATLAEELPQGTIRFRSKLTRIERQVLQDSSVVHILLLEDGTIITAKVLIGCEGVHSVVAGWMGLAAPIHSGRTAIRGISVLPQGHEFDKEHLQLVGHGIKAGIVPINDTEIYWYLTYVSTPRDQQVAKDPELIHEESLKLAQHLPPKVKDLVSCSQLAKLTCDALMLRVPWDIIMGRTHRGCVTVVGDAFHPMTPDLAQGGCTALEDAVVLARCIASARNNAEAGIRKYVNERKWRVALLVTAAYVHGWDNQSRSWLLNSLLKFIKRHVVGRLLTAPAEYHCGVLPSSSSSS